MSTPRSAQRDIGDEIGRGPLARGAAFVYRMLVLEGQLLLAILPTGITVLLLGRDPSNLPLFVLALLPVAPALVAGVAATRAAAADPDLAPGRHFFRAYRRDLAPTLRWAVPAALILAVLTFNLSHLGAVEGGAALRPVILLIAALVLIWGGHMVILTASFTFRTRDAARIALAQIVPRWGFSLGILSLLVISCFLIITLSELALLLLLWAAVVLLELMARPVVDDVTARFTHSPTGS